MRNATEWFPANRQTAGERVRPLLVLLPADTTGLATEAAVTGPADLLDRIDACADLALEAQHHLELRENEARKDGDAAEIERFDALAGLFRQRYLAVSGLRAAALTDSPIIQLAADQIAAVNNSLGAEIQNLTNMQPSYERLSSIAEDIDKVVSVVRPLVVAG
jgi:hypothetical protein